MIKKNQQFFYKKFIIDTQALVIEIDKYLWLRLIRINSLIDKTRNQGQTLGYKAFPSLFKTNAIAASCWGRPR